MPATKCKEGILASRFPDPLAIEDHENIAKQSQQAHRLFLAGYRVIKKSVYTHNVSIASPNSIIGSFRSLG